MAATITTLATKPERLRRDQAERLKAALQEIDAQLGSEGPSLRKRTVRNENTGEILPISSEKS